MHNNELKINESIIYDLIKQQRPDLSHLPLKSIASSGTDNLLFRLGNDYVIRLPRINWAVASIDKEYQWLPILDEFLNTPISVPLFKGTPDKTYPWNWLISKWNEGHNPSFEQKNEYASLAKDLAYFLNDLQSIKLPNGPLSRRGIPLKEKDIETRKAIIELEDEIDTKLVTQLWEELSNIPYWQKSPVWVHGDFLPGNILIQNNKLSAVIDFSDIGMGDPACDLIIAWSLFNSSSRKIFRENLKNIDDNAWARGKGWALSIALIILPYYKNSNSALTNIAKRILSEISEEI